MSILEQLKVPFKREDIEFRIGRVNQSANNAFVLAYITSRAVMERLDSVFGIGGWKDEYLVLSQGASCKLSIAVDDVWITKEDAAPFTNIESLKGAYSDALKRVAVKFGIGRYLYKLPESFVDIKIERPRNPLNKVHYCNSNGLTGYWEEPDLPSWALPVDSPESKRNTVDEKHKTKFKKESNNSNNDKISLQVELLEKLQDLLRKKALSEKKALDYQEKIEDQNVGIGLLHYFKKQFQLIENLYKLEETIPINKKREYYLAILKGNMKNLSDIGIKLENIQHSLIA